MSFTGPLEDRIAIRELHGTYADTAFRSDMAGWLDCWTDDCVWVTPFGEVRGKEAMTEQWNKIGDSFGFIAAACFGDSQGDEFVRRRRRQAHSSRAARFKQRRRAGELGPPLGPIAAIRNGGDPCPQIVRQLSPRLAVVDQPARLHPGEEPRMPPRIIDPRPRGERRDEK